MVSKKLYDALLKIFFAKYSRITVRGPWDLTLKNVIPASFSKKAFSELLCSETLPLPMFRPTALSFSASVADDATDR